MFQLIPTFFICLCKIEYWYYGQMYIPVAFRREFSYAAKKKRLHSLRSYEKKKKLIDFLRLDDDEYIDPYEFYTLKDLEKMAKKEQEDSDKFEEKFRRELIDKIEAHPVYDRYLNAFEDWTIADLWAFSRHLYERREKIWNKDWEFAFRCSI